MSVCGCRLSSVIADTPVSCMSYFLHTYVRRACGDYFGRSDLSGENERWRHGMTERLRDSLGSCQLLVYNEKGGY